MEEPPNWPPKWPPGFGVYVLNEKGEPRRPKDIFDLGNINLQRVALDMIEESEVSTVFRLCSTDKPPTLWETMVFGGPHHGRQERCSGSREQAEAMHARIVAELKGGEL